MAASLQTSRDDLKKMEKGEAPPDALRLLAADHRKVEDLFEQFEKARGAEKKGELARQICTELKIHAELEERIFYPAVRGKIEADLLDEAYVEHDGAKVLIQEIEAGEPDEAFYDAKVKVLSEQIEHHVKEEERQEDSMFAQVRKADVDLEALGQQMWSLKQELMAEAEAGALPPAETRTFAGDDAEAALRSSSEFGEPGGKGTQKA
ncbi:hemerythrin domain-containing protein [Brevundimonas sp. 2R-24]|uniref:Hemerythrin domain-containing protein n=1 Tax=Peiella sedimenti TaxID=3061083 RepID=A0ABT8SRK9_9CAUL|nr:hemerythrin domain-containing protein [Caulobacteraceae bacterium XZ-24]